MSTVCGKMISACVQASQTPLLICISSFSAADCNCAAAFFEHPPTESRRLCGCDMPVSASSAISLPRSSPCHGSCSSFTTTFISAYYLIFRGGMQVAARHFANIPRPKVVRKADALAGMQFARRWVHGVSDMPQQWVSLPPID